MCAAQGRSDVAIVGMACRLPGANGLDQFWKLLRDGGIAWGPAPEDRFQRQRYFDAKRSTLNRSYSDLAALVDYVPVDRTACPINDRDEASYDLAHLTLCEVAAKACRHAGLDPSRMPHDNTGVYVGSASASGFLGEYTLAAYIAQTAKYLRDSIGFEQLADGLGDEVIRETIETIRRPFEREQPGAELCVGVSHAARIIAKVLNLNGPCMAFNAACASSSRALLQAVRALQFGQIEMAIVGGASFYHVGTSVMFAQSHSLSARGSCPFTDQADGMIIGEGYTAVVLKSLDRAVAEGDRVLGVIPSIGGSSDGHGKSLWAPRYEGQVLAINRAYNERVSMADVQYVEAHATSTNLGDVTELKALTTAFAPHLPQGRKLPIGSVKLNVGHTLECAGLTGLIKTVLALEHQTIPPALRAGSKLTSDVDWQAMPFVAAEKAIAWPKSGKPRRAGVNSFGIGGLNVHIVVDDYVATPSATGRGMRFDGSAEVTTVSRQTASDEHDIAIIGMGAVLPGALTREALRELFASGRDPKSEAPEGRWDTDVFYRPEGRSQWQSPSTRGGYIHGFRYDWRRHKIPPKQIDQATPLQFMILDAVDQAIQQAGYHERPLRRTEVGVVVGTVFGGEFSSQLAIGLRLPEIQELMGDLLRRNGVPHEQIEKLMQSYAQTLLKRLPALLDETGSFTASALASRITKSFDLMGGAVAVDAGRASSMAALSCCIDQLRSGDTEMMICVGGQQDMSPTHFMQMASERRLALGNSRSPFDAKADGVLPGEGCGALLLKRLVDARRDNDPILGIIRGIGASVDYRPAEASKLAISRARRDARSTAPSVAAIEMMPTGDLANDAAEVEAIADAYRDNKSPAAMILGTAVDQLGDTGGASAMASLLKCAMELDVANAPAATAFESPASFITPHAATLAVPCDDVALKPDADGRLVAGIHSGGKHEVAYHVLLERGTPLKPTDHDSAANTQPTREPSPSANRRPGKIVYFDATTRRRERARLQAEPQKSARPLEPVTPRATRAAASDVETPVNTPAMKTPAPVMTKPADTSPAPKQTPPKQTAPSAATPSPTTPPPTKPIEAASSAKSDATNLDAAELETFLINFVVEQTGYPTDLVELDADLEADLGIDSIKKAQLFGELGEYFDVQPSEDLTLDDFTTLRHVLNFLLSAEVGVTQPLKAAEETPAPVAKTTPVATTATSTTPTSPAPSVSKAQPVATPAAPPVRETAPDTSIEDPKDDIPTQDSLGGDKLDPVELETFLVNFVIEQTGYPSDLVELDADLEADLGIDSIKKAQLFGELGEYFDVQPSEDLTLDDFTTLRHVLNFLLKAQISGPTPSKPR